MRGIDCRTTLYSSIWAILNWDARVRQPSIDLHQTRSILCMKKLVFLESEPSTIIIIIDLGRSGVPLYIAESSCAPSAKCCVGSFEYSIIRRGKKDSFSFLCSLRSTESSSIFLSIFNWHNSRNANPKPKHTNQQNISYYARATAHRRLIDKSRATTQLVNSVGINKRQRNSSKSNLFGWNMDFFLPLLN